MIPKSLLLLLLSIYSTTAGLFIGPMTPDHRFVVNAGETALLNILPSFGRSFDLYLGDKKISGQFGSDFVTKAALIGPAELVITNLGAGSSSVSFNYRILTNSQVQGLFIDAQTNASIDVPANRTAHIMGVMGFVLMTLKQGDSVGYVQKFPPDMEIEGPVTITLDTSSTAAYVTYFLKDAVTIVPDGAVLKAPPGNFEINLQKSMDLTNWLPSVVIPTASDGAAYYRLKID